MLFASQVRFFLRVVIAEDWESLTKQRAAAAGPSGAEVCQAHTDPVPLACLLPPDTSAREGTRGSARAAAGLELTLGDAPSSASR